MKGFSAFIYSIILFFAFLIVLLGLTLSINVFQPFSKRTETIKGSVYTINNALELARIYVETALTYSVFRALDDLNEQGLEVETSKSDVRKMVESKLEELVKEHMKGYWKESNTFEFINVDVTMKIGDEVKISVSPEADSLHASIRGLVAEAENRTYDEDGNLLERVRIRKRIDVDNYIPVNYLLLIERVAEEFERVKNNGCKKDEGGEKPEGGEGDVSIEVKKEGTTCIINAVLEDKKVPGVDKKGKKVVLKNPGLKIKFSAKNQET